MSLRGKLILGVLAGIVMWPMIQFAIELWVFMVR